MGMTQIELRKKLVERLRIQSLRIHNQHNDEALEKLVLVHQAILALDEVQAAGGPLETHARATGMDD